MTGDKEKENHAKDDVPGPENNTPVDNNSGPDQPDNNFQEQPGDDTSEQPEQPSQPDQPSNSNQQTRNSSQSANIVQGDQIILLENQASDFMNQKESVEQPIQDSQPQESGEILSDQANSQQNQAAAGITEPGVSNVSISFSEGFSILSVGFGAIVAFRLIQVLIQQKYLLQLLSVKISIMDTVNPIYKFLEGMNPMQVRFGKIKCRTGFTKEEALAFFRECQRLPLTWDRRYG